MDLVNKFEFLPSVYSFPFLGFYRSLMCCDTDYPSTKNQITFAIVPAAYCFCFPLQPPFKGILSCLRWTRQPNLSDNRTIYTVKFYSCNRKRV
ncbi:hypothetical protein K2173_020241 [Erythroxylum novogranatense]|uniref:Uncharacterized protein n=1 Tax=Erythroxylum novogranatense TaxID=1862640 RepID=A0AAV8U7D6_9ROSI|nr:hypothetical protein K2173_020241 [Erythroxylum novogranatense]